MNEIPDPVPAADCHYWHPIPDPDGRRHAFRGARRWPGHSSAETVCGTEVPLARPSEMDWIYLPTCEHCWNELLAQQHSREEPE